ncbi:MAG: right-handed parallel beta-helix repeat-containing protein [Kiritimatiellae bacterium]|nr:right-handed parallel beta-helix repeat-containing protein [Kiritimatiellia bacterium]
MRTVVVALAVLSLLPFSPSLAQGPLDPPGAPAAMMRTLEQVEPRVPITNLPYSILGPGSYYLTGNLTGASGFSGIDVNSEDVTIDLCGFSLDGVPGSISGIYNAGNRNFAVRNGTVRGWGQNGIDFSAAVNCEIQNVRALVNGATGVAVGKGSRISGCEASQNVTGLSAGDGSVVENSVARQNTTGISAQSGCRVSGCAASENAGPGITVGGRGLVSECTVYWNGTNGVLTGQGVVVANCAVGYNYGDGIVVDGDCHVRDNNCQYNGMDDSNGANIHALGNGNRIEGNQLSGADRGLDVDGTGNYVADNTVRGNTDNYDFADGNELNLLLCEMPENLDWPCSVRLAGTLVCSQDLTTGITVNAHDVSIDLAGHALVGPGLNSAYGIYQGAGLRNLRVLNGQVVCWRGSTQGGLYAGGVCSDVSDLVAVSNATGIAVREASSVRNCAAYGNSEDGIVAYGGCTVVQCTANGNDRVGIYVDDHCSVLDSVAHGNLGSGIEVSEGSRVERCVCNLNNAAGIQATGNGYCRIDGNQIHQNATGLDVVSTHNVIVRNTVSYNTANFSVAANNATGIVISVTGGGEVSGDPWANIEF